MIRGEISEVDFGQEFESAIIADLMHQKHYQCSAQDLRPSRFRKLPRPESVYDLQGYFPGHRWHGVSWTQCIDPGDEMAWLDRALRDAAHPIVWRYRAAHSMCERCGEKPSTEVDHVSPEFNVMVAQIIQTLSASQVDEIFSRFDWLEKEPFSLPPGHSALQLLNNAHQAAILQAVCQPCHVLNGNERRR